MKIAVCIKQVPAREWQPRLSDDRTWIREQDASFEMNEPDAYALEEALRLREKHGGERRQDDASGPLSEDRTAGVVTGHSFPSDDADILGGHPNIVGKPTDT